MSATSALPRENLIRAYLPGVEVRALEDGTQTLAGHFAVFNQPTEISSMMEGNFIETIAPGAFKKTFRENLRQIKVLFQHGNDPQVGDKPLGGIRSLSEDETGAAYEVDLVDASYVRDIIPGLLKGLYGASFRFKVMREDIVEDPKSSKSNPKGLPERTIREAKVMEFGPVTFPAYDGATAGVRSLTDDFIMRGFLQQPDKLRALLTEFLPTSTRAIAETEDGDDIPDDPAPTDDSAEPEAHPASVRRTTQIFGLNRETKPLWKL